MTASRGTLPVGEASPFPESPRVLYSKNPLEEVICQLRFPPILAIVSAQPAEFQNGIREHYPFYAAEEGGPQLPGALAELLSTLAFPSSQITVHRFDSEDYAKSVHLSRDYVAVSSRHYKRWEDFGQEVAMAQRTLETVYHPPFYTRLGLRYRNIINPSALGLESFGWEDLVNPWMLGPLGSSHAKSAVQATTMISRIVLHDVTGGFV